MGKGIFAQFIVGSIIVLFACHSVAKSPTAACSDLFSPPNQIQHLGKKLVAPFYENTEDIQNSMEELRIHIYGYLSRWALDLNKVTSGRDLSEEETATLALLKKTQKKVAKPTWFYKKAIKFTSFVESSPQYELGAFAQLFIVDQIMSAEKTSWPKEAREFIADRFLKKYTGQILWWGPMLIIYVKWGDQIYAYLDALLN